MRISDWSSDVCSSDMLDARNNQTDAEAADPLVPARDDLGEVVAGVDLEQRERDLRGVERLLGEPEHHDRVLASREHQARERLVQGQVASVRVDLGGSLSFKSTTYISDTNNIII